MKKALLFGGLFLVVSLGGAGALIYGLMLEDEKEVRLKRFVRYEQCLSWKESSNCEYTLVGMESFRPGDMTESEGQTIKRIIGSGGSREEAMKRIYSLREADLQEELVVYKKWKRGEYLR